MSTEAQSNFLLLTHLSITVKYAIIEKMKSIQICAVVQILANRFSAGSEKEKGNGKAMANGKHLTALAVKMGMRYYE